MCKNKKQALISLVITILLAAVFFGIGSHKSGFHLDEIYTFGLSNHQYSESQSLRLTITDGVSYNGEDIWQKYTGVSEGGRFDYANVFENQTHDVHPPLYYILIHTVSSLFPWMSSVWAGLLVNVPLACIVYWQLVWIAQKLRLRRSSAMILSAFYVLGIGFVDHAVVFLRMYALLAVWVNLLAMLFLRERAEEKGTLRYYLSLGAVILGGMLTQYYFLIYAFLICLVYAVFVALARNWKKLFLSLAAALASGGVGILIFPAVLKHIFGGYRGEEAFDNALTSSLHDHLWKYLDLINADIFGGLFSVVLTVLLCLLIVSAGKRVFPKEQVQSYMLLVIPVCIYVLIIAKIAPYQMLRYVVSTTALLYLAVFACMAEAAPKKADVYLLLLAGILFFCGYRNEIENLYLDHAETDRQLAAYSESQCVYVYDEQWRLLVDYPELRFFDNIVFLSEESWQESESVEYDCESMIVFVSEYLDLSQDEVLERLMNENGLMTCTEMFTSEYAKVYCLEQ